MNANAMSASASSVGLSEEGTRREKEREIGPEEMKVLASLDR